MPDQSDFNGWVCTKPFQLQLPVSRAKNVLFLVQGGHLFQGKFYHLLLGRKGEVKKLSLHLLFLKCLQLKINHILKLHMEVRGALLIPFS